ncbi:hypothetical protein HPB52_016600 [Rhipicephalus sanguineus]|uniref:Uncharacterized protein n=1 Tax=Rhipicephalus sanguineus TaxID=34632 RepID=A0A9D4Q7P0_RHISA|nr:hypothetical protein HPB52_016600 [Rhipicephalus sanguineus]
MFVPYRDEDTEVAHQAEYNFKAIEVYNTTMKPSTVLRIHPKYLYRLINGTAFSARGYSDDWKDLIGTDLDDLATPVEKLSDSLTTDTAYVAKWREAEKKLYDCWETMEITLSNRMNEFYTLVGSCQRIGTIYKRSFDVFCYAILANLNGVWCALWLVCLLFTVTIVVNLKLSKYLMRMDDYMYEGVEVEESIDLEEILCDVEVKRVREIRQRLGLPANQPLPIGGQPPMRPMGRGAGPRAMSPRGPSPRAAVPPGAHRAP